MRAVPPAGVGGSVGEADRGHGFRASRPCAREAIESAGERPVATVEAGGAEVTALQDGRYRFSPAREGVSLAVSAPGYLQAHQTYGGGDSQRLSLAPILRGTVTDARTGRPIPGATVGVGSRILTADDEGGFRLPARVTSGTLWALSPGHRRAEADLATHGSYDLALEPFAARALYLTFFGVGNDDLRTNVVSLLTEANGLNAVVIDVKGDRGYIAYPTKVELAARIGANSHHTIDDVDGLVRGLHARKVYVIARIVVMKDDLLARNGAAVGVDVAITKKGSHEPWIDGEGLGWVDPFKSPVWDYNVALAREAAEHGF